MSDLIECSCVRVYVCMSAKEKRKKRKLVKKKKRQEEKRSELVGR